MAYSSAKEAYEKYYDADNDFATYFAYESSFFSDAITQPMQLLCQFFKSGALKGELLIQYGGSNSLALLLPACGHFKEVIVIEFLEGRLKCFQNWLNKDSAAYDYSQTLKKICELGGDGVNETEKEETARKSIKEVIKGEATDSHPMAPKLAVQADCLITSYSTELICANRNAYRAALRSMSSLIKIGGCVILNVLLGCTFAMVGKYKLPILYLKEEFVKEAVTDAGFDISEHFVTPRINDTLYTTIDFESIMFLIAHKVRHVE